MKPWIQTWSGRKFDLLDPTPDMVDLRDLAEALAKVNRFSGHTKRPYSVAQHSVFCSRFVSEKARPYALLHDAEEAYIGDLSTPLKSALVELGARDALSAMVDRIRAAVFRRFKLQTPCPGDIWAEVKAADAMALATERRDLLHRHLDWGIALPEPLIYTLSPVPWWEAAQMFYDRALDVGLGEMNYHSVALKKQRTEATVERISLSALKLALTKLNDIPWKDHPLRKHLQQRRRAFGITRTHIEHTSGHNNRYISEWLSGSRAPHDEQLTDLCCTVRQLVAEGYNMTYYRPGLGVSR